MPSAAAMSERAFARLHCLQATFRAAHSVSTDERGGGTWRTKKRPKKRLTGITRGLVGPAQRNLRLCNGQVGRDEGGLSRDSRPPSLDLLQLRALPPCLVLTCLVLFSRSAPIRLHCGSIYLANMTPGQTEFAIWLDLLNGTLLKCSSDAYTTSN